MPDEIPTARRPGQPLPGTRSWPLVCDRAGWASPASAGLYAPVAVALPTWRWCPICAGEHRATASGVLGWHLADWDGVQCACPGENTPGLERKPTPTRKANTR